MEQNNILKILYYNNKLYEENNSINYSMLLYELHLYFEELKNSLNTNDNIEFIAKNKLLSNRLKDIFIDKRKLPHIKKYLLIFKLRRFLFNLYNDSISELYCLMDICKAYKTLWEKGISENEISEFIRYIFIYLNKLLNINDNILVNIDKKLFLIPLKYYVRYFSEIKCYEITFEKAG